MIAQRIAQHEARIRSIADAKFGQVFWRQAARGQIFAGVGRFGPAQLLLKKVAGALVDFDQPAAHFGVTCFLRRGVAHLRQGNLQLLRYQPHSFGKSDVLDLLHEGENVSRCPAAEAVEKLPRGVNGERWRFFLVEGTQALEVLRAAFAQLNVLAHDADDVSLLLDGIRKIPWVGHRPSLQETVAICQSSAIRRYR